MKPKHRQSGVTLTEMTAVIAVVAMLTVLGLPAIRTFFSSFETQGGTKAMISAALSTARAIAAREQRYAGIRFQKAYRPDGPLKAPQYIIFIVHDFDKTGLASGFRAVEGIQPIKLPDSIGVMDLMVRIYTGITYDDAEKTDDQLINTDTLINSPEELTDTTAFSVVFSPSGKMVVHNVRVRNKTAIPRPNNDIPTKISMDDIFNSPENIVNNNTGMFVQDDYAHLGLGTESSRKSFIIYEREKFRQAYEKGQAYSGYLYKLVDEAVYINPYTGRIIGSR